MYLQHRIQDLRRTALNVCKKIVAESSLKATPQSIWLHTDKDGTHVRVNVGPGEALKAAGLLKCAGKIFPVRIVERPLTTQEKKMSADNGIYILKTKAPTGEGFEYRFTHAMAIENICYNVETGEYQKDFIPAVAYDYFGTADVFTDEREVLAYAHEEAKQYDVLEYGVSFLEHSHQVFPSDLTSDDVERYEVEVDKEMSRRRAKRETEQQEWLEKNRQPIYPMAAGCFATEDGGKFTPAVTYGQLVRKDGSTVYGRIEYDANGPKEFVPQR